MVENTEKNREKLVAAMVDDWDWETLVLYAHETLCKFFDEHDESFQLDWREQFPEESDE